MELNREQIIMALECCGEYTHGTTCNNCPYMLIELTDNDICSNRMSRDALSLIKELTEDVERLRKQCGEIIVECDERDAERLKQVAELTAENERLRADVAKEFTCVFGKPHKVSDCPITDEIAKAKADTVRKMQERLMQKILENTVGNDSFAYFLKGYIDQVTKEMEEGKG